MFNTSNFIEKKKTKQKKKEIKTQIYLILSFYLFIQAREQSQPLNKIKLYADIFLKIKINLPIKNKFTNNAMLTTISLIIKKSIQ